MSNFVSCICVTYNRRRFLPYLLRIYSQQEYPASKRELVILDDSPVSNKDIIDEFMLKNPKENIKYHYHKEKIPLGKKRNMINKLTKGDIIVNFDDDDYYPPEKVKHLVKMMNQRKADVCGSSEIHIYFTQTQQMMVSGPFSSTHSTNGTIAYTRNWLKGGDNIFNKTNPRSYDDEAVKAEEKKFLDDFSNPILQLESLKTILCIAHGENTVDKYPMRQNMRPSKHKLKDIVKDKVLYDFYISLGKEYKDKFNEQQALELLK
jgi:glycosyltransferase involved in cell wall biosynthesis